MSLNTAEIKRLLTRKIATLVLLSASVAAFATLGDDSGKKNLRNTSSTLVASTSKTFSLRSNYNYKSNHLFGKTQDRKAFIMLNPVVTYQRGNTAYVLPLKKMPLSGKITFTNTPSRY